MNKTPKLADLIQAARKGGDVSYERLSQACGGQPSAKRLHQLQNGVMKSFPDPDTIKSLSRGTGFSVLEVLLAAARSLELRVPALDEDALRIYGLSAIPDRVQDLMQELGREIVILAEGKLAADAQPLQQQIPAAYYELAADDHSNDQIGFDDDPHET